MDKAKAAVSDFMHKAGHHDTTVHEKVAPAVTNENVVQKRHEEAQTAIDREIHQDHYHTSVQPVHDREVLPEKHHHNMIPVEHREHQHGNPDSVKARLEQEAAQFADSRQVRKEESHSVAPVIAGEHVHHHVHETIQPVVQKETIQPSVVHTTVPIHEVHQNEAKHHTSSALPAVSMADFKKQGGSLTGREERYDGFEGEPRAVGSALSGAGSTGTGTGAGYGSGTTGTGTGYGSSTTSGPHSSKLENKLDPRVDSDRDGSRNLGATGAGTGYGSGTTGTGTGYGSHTTSGPHSSNLENKVDPRVDSDRDGSRNLGATGAGAGYGTGTTGTGTGYGSGTTGSGYDNTTGTTTGKKPGLMDKLNPLKDSDRDGKKGFME
ncbi:MAG: hypothetical protein Q9191_007054 [Dirinaria sp. TL-2023a]